MLKMLLNAAILVGVSSQTMTMECRSHETSCHGVCIAGHKQCCSDGTACQSFEKCCQGKCMAGHKHMQCCSDGTVCPDYMTCCQGKCILRHEKCDATVTAQSVQATSQAASQMLTPSKPSASEPPLCAPPQPEPDLRTDITQRLSYLETENARLEAETDHLRAENARLRDWWPGLVAENARLAAEAGQLRALLTAWLGEKGKEYLASGSSGAPPLSLPKEDGGAPPSPLEVGHDFSIFVFLFLIYHLNVGRCYNSMFLCCAFYATYFPGQYFACLCILYFAGSGTVLPRQLPEP